jgi:hypothetical protein
MLAQIGEIETLINVPKQMIFRDQLIEIEGTEQLVPWFVVAPDQRASPRQSTQTDYLIHQ